MVWLKVEGFGDECCKTLFPFLLVDNEKIASIFNPVDGIGFMSQR